jgi:hypothetical protein
MAFTMQSAFAQFSISSARDLFILSSGFDQGGPAAPIMYAEGPYSQQPAPKPSRFWIWLVVGLGVGGLLCAGCCGGLTWFGFSAGTQALAQALRQEIAGNADVQEHLGEINSVKMNIMETANEQKTREGANNLMVFDAEGTKGNGKFITETPAGGQGGGPFSKIELRLPDGKTIPIK